MPRESKQSASPKVDPIRLRRDRPQTDPEPEPSAIPISAGPVERIIDLVYNPSREKVREMTVIDRIQGRLLPQLDLIDVMWQYAIEVATFRESAPEYVRVYKRQRPVPPNLIGEFTYRTAQWQKSVGGTNLKSAIDLTLADIEARSSDAGEFDTDAWKDA